jgi:KRAB domain-containing zinc finger protein
LQKHLRNHSGEKQYSCSQCSKSFARVDKLQIHLRIHSGEKPYSCENCTKSFARSYHLKRHVKSGVCRKSAEFIGHMNTFDV